MQSSFRWERYSQKVRSCSAAITLSSRILQGCRGGSVNDRSVSGHGGVDASYECLTQPASRLHSCMDAEGEEMVPQALALPASSPACKAWSRAAAVQMLTATVLSLPQ